MGVYKEHFSMPYGVAEVVRETSLGDGYRGELGAGSFRHLPCDRRLIVSAVLEGKRKSTNRRPSVASHQGQYTAGIDTAAQVAADRNIGPHTQADGFIQDGKESFRIFLILERRDAALFGKIEIPVSMSRDAPG